MKMNTRFAKGAAIVALVALVALPLSAWAASGNGHGSAGKGNSATAHAPKAPKVPKVNTHRSATAAAKLAGKHAALEARIAKMLSNRERAFDNAASKISSRIDKVASIAATVAVAGGNVDDVLAQLQSARDKVAAAMATEEAAVVLFKAVPDATDRKAAFTEAKAQAHLARVQMSSARDLLRNAIRALEVVINGLVPPVTS
jgi:hypothetical protein